jgi:hypothetical protein
MAHSTRTATQNKSCQSVSQEQELSESLQSQILVGRLYTSKLLFGSQQIPKSNTERCSAYWLQISIAVLVSSSQLTRSLIKIVSSTNSSRVKGLHNSSEYY